MGSGRALFFGIAAAALVAGCGGGGHRQSTTSSTQSSSTNASAGNPSNGIRARLLTRNELAGFRPVGVSISKTRSSWVSGEPGVPPDQQAAETAMLKRDGFRIGARENLANGSTPGLSVVEQFRSPSAERDAFALYSSQFKAPGSSAGKYAPFKVRGIPGAVGFSLGGANGGGINIAFGSGAYYYLVGQVGGSVKTIDNLVAAAQHLYHRVHP
jgi:hypothetical protein